jgi:hypothetical protein
MARRTWTARWVERDGEGGQYVIRYEKHGEMERVLEKQAELLFLVGLNRFFFKKNIMNLATSS